MSAVGRFDQATDSSHNRRLEVKGVLMRLRPAPSHWLILCAWGAVAIVALSYAGLSFWGASALGLPWWLGALPVVLVFLASDSFHRETLRHELAKQRAEPINEDDDPRLHAIADRLAGLTGQAKPRFQSLASATPHAFTLTHPPSGSGPTVFLSSGLLQRLGNVELEAVLAHEYAHIEHRDQRLLNHAEAVTQWTAFLPLLLVQQLFALERPLCRLAHRCGRRWTPHTMTPQEEAESLDAAPAPSFPRPVSAVAIPVVAAARGLALILGLLLYPVACAATYAGALIALPGFVVTASLTRRREVAADAAAARTTGSPFALVSALTELTEGVESIPRRDLRRTPVISGQGIVPVDPPSKIPRAEVGGWVIIMPLLDTHPSLKRRTARLEAIARGGGLQASPAPPSEALGIGDPTACRVQRSHRAGRPEE